MKNSDVIAYNKVRTYTKAQLKDTAFRHGTDRIMFYPPSMWDCKVNPEAQALYGRFYNLGVKWMARKQRSSK